MTTWPRIVPALIAVAVLATGCGGSDSSGGSSPSSSASASATPTLKLSAVPTTGPAAGPTITGAGYSYSAPRGWADITSKMKTKDSRVVTAARPTTLTPPFTASMNTFDSKNSLTGALTEKDVTALGKQLATQLAGTVPKATVSEAVMLDGAPAIPIEGVASAKNPKFYLVQYFAVHEDTNVAITFSFPRSTSKADRDKLVAAVLASWTWS